MLLSQHMRISFLRFYLVLGENEMNISVTHQKTKTESY